MENVENSDDTRLRQMHRASQNFSLFARGATDLIVRMLCPVRLMELGGVSQ